MGGTHSSVRIKTTNYSIGFILYYDNSYKKIVITCANGENAATSISGTTIYEFNNYGEEFTYDGDTQKLYNILANFNPRIDTPQILFSRLCTECDLQKYENVCYKIYKWVCNVVTFIPRISYNFLKGTLQIGY